MNEMLGITWALVAMMMQSTDALFDDTPVACAADAKPAMMIVEGVNEKPEQFKKYADALKASQLYERLEGYYEAIGDPVEVHEGLWDEKKFFVVVRFPCAERIRQFWNSNTYQAIKPMREGAGDVRVIVFEEMPIPERISWTSEPPANE